jgi:hypothetical protein
MEDLQSAARIINDNDVSFQRRANMLGQHLTNLGFEGVKVAIDVKITVNNDTGQHTRNLSGEYGKFVAGVGDFKIGGQGSNWTPGGSPTVTGPATPPSGSLPTAWSNPGRNAGNGT